MRAGTAGAEAMVTKRIHAVPLGFILCLLAALVSMTAIEPRPATAKPVTTDGSDGSPYGTGDPTGDDIPSPTPKPSALKAPQVVAPMSGTRAIRRSFHSSDRWNVYLSILIRLGLR